VAIQEEFLSPKMCKFKPGDCVKFILCLKEQVNWGGNDDPMKVITIGETYTIKTVDVHSSHTKVTLEGINGRFNSVHFEKV